MHGVSDAMAAAAGRRRLKMEFYKELCKRVFALWALKRRILVIRKARRKFERLLGKAKRQQAVMEKLVDQFMEDYPLGRT